MTIEQIFQERVRIANVRESATESYCGDYGGCVESAPLKLSCCRAVLGTQLTKGHPYEVGRAERDGLARVCPAYRCGARGTVGTPLPVEHLYRLTAITTLANPKNKYWKKEYGETGESAYTILSQKARNTEDGWLPLEEAMSGVLSNFHGISWWTDFMIASVTPDPLPTMPAGTGTKATIHSGYLGLARQLGLINGWLGEELLIYRLRPEAIDKNRIRIPTSMDGFESPVFKASDRLVQSGTTMNLLHQPGFENGLSEFVIHEIETKHVEIMPVNVGRIGRDERYEYHGDALRANLLQYYRSLA